MNKLNSLGETLLDYKSELVKDYPPLVRTAMIKAIRDLLEEEKIESNVMPLLIDANESKNKFKEFISTKAEFIKPYEELLQEFELLGRDVISRCSNMNIDEIYAEPDVDKDMISTFITFTCTEEYVMEHFGVSEQELIKLMKKGGFIEMYVSLRLSKVVKDIIQSFSSSISYISLDQSLAYANPVNNGYSMDLIMNVNVNDYEKDEYKNSILEEIRLVSEEARKTFLKNF